MSVSLPADHTAPDPPPRLARPAAPANGRPFGRPFGQRIRVPKTAELVAAELRRKIVRGELADLLPDSIILYYFIELAYYSDPRSPRPGKVCWADS